MQKADVDIKQARADGIERMPSEPAACFDWDEERKKKGAPILYTNESEKHGVYETPPFKKNMKKIMPNRSLVWLRLTVAIYKQNNHLYRVVF
jgi:hypothetical protein